MRLSRLFAFILLAMLVLEMEAKTHASAVPWIGAEIFIEPGQKPEDIDLWFQRLSEAGMKKTRVRLFESYMRDVTGKWDFSLFDRAYAAAEKWGVGIYGNLFPATSFSDVGGFKFPTDEAHWESVKTYTRTVVDHFKQFKSCEGWVPINEPGTDTLPDTPYVTKRQGEWATVHATGVYGRGGYPILSFERERFLTHLTTEYLRDLVAVIREVDPEGEIHVNSHAIFSYSAFYDFPVWSTFLDSLGGSAHASWHFGYYPRSRYALAMLANSEIIRAASRVPWFMTELQGGNNIYSGMDPLCPTPEEITQWCWIPLFSEAKGAMFWCLNPRRSGFEAGEWAMLNLDNTPSGRLDAAKRVAETISQRPTLWSHARREESGITVLFTRESMWVESKLMLGSSPLPGRSRGGVMKSAITYFDALSALGYSPALAEIGTYDFSRASYLHQTIVLPHQVALAARYWPQLAHFVASGGTLVIEGLTGFYDENAVCIAGDRWPLREVFGGYLREVRLTAPHFDFAMPGAPEVLPAHLWSFDLCSDREGAAAPASVLVSQYGQGRTIWLGATVGLGAYAQGDLMPLARYLEKIIMPSPDFPLPINTPGPDVLVKHLRSGSDIITLLVNAASETRDIAIKRGKNGRRCFTLFPQRQTPIEGSSLQLKPGETCVLLWPES